MDSDVAPDQGAEQDLDDAINVALKRAGYVSRSRENSLVITKLEEARSWNTLDIQRKEGS